MPEEGMESRQDVSDGVDSEVAKMKIAGWVREHGQNVFVLARILGVRGTRLVDRIPPLAPFPVKGRHI